MTLQEKIGQRLMVGFDGTKLSPEFIEFVRKHKIANFCISRRNVKNRDQLKQLCREIQDLVIAETGHPALLSLTQEGGCVTRLSEDMVNIPGAMALAATGDEKYIYRASVLMAAELRALGLNYNLAPVADINNNPDNPIIGARSYGETPEQVTRYLLAALKGYMDGGVMTSIKHFPGHGDTGMDSHVSLPMIDKPLERLKTMELVPFQAAIDAGCPSVMTTHILFPQIEPERVPATMSRRIITGLLKEQMGFRGIVISDAMEMDAISKYYGVVEGSVAAMKAGVDIILIGQTAKVISQVVEAMCQEAESGRVPMDELDASVEKILHSKERYAAAAQGEVDSTSALQETMELRRRTITLYQGTVPPMGKSPVFLGCEDYRAGLVSNQETTENTFAGYMAAAFGGKGIVTSKDPQSEEIECAVSQAADHSAVFVNTYNGHLFPGQMELVRRLTQLHIPMAVVALRDPYDLRGLPPEVAAIAAWDYSQDTLDVLVPILAGKEHPQGRMPIRIG